MPEDAKGDVGEVFTEEEEVIEGPLEISFNAIAGVLGVSSIRLVEKINGKEASFLVAGATHNFIDPMTTNWLGLKGVKVGTFEVIVADGEKIVGRKCCSEIKPVTQNLRP